MLGSRGQFRFCSVQSALKHLNVPYNSYQYPVFKTDCRVFALELWTENPSGFKPRNQYRRRKFSDTFGFGRRSAALLKIAEETASLELQQ